jgi:thiol-disulfide isomerase/thioredoxin
VLDLAGGALPFTLVVGGAGAPWRARLCNGRSCEPITRVRAAGDSVVFEIADYAATIAARVTADSLVGRYYNVGNRGPRTIPFRASRGRWPAEPGPPALLGSWDASFFGDWGATPRVFRIANGPRGLEGTVLSNTGDYGDFWGWARGDSFALAHFDGSFVYLVTGRLDGDTLRGAFHAGLRSETPWKAVRSTGAPHLADPTTLTRADTAKPFRFAFPDLEGKVVSSDDRRFGGKVLLVDVFGTWCPTCHEEAPTLVDLYRRYHARGLEIVGLAYEVSGDPAVDAPLVRRYREKFGIPFPLLLAGTNDVDAAAATLPQLTNFTSFPTAIFIGRDGRVRLVHDGFYGPAAGARHGAQVAAFRREVERLLAER